MHFNCSSLAHALPHHILRPDALALELRNQQEARERTYLDSGRPSSRPAPSESDTEPSLDHTSSWNLLFTR